MKKVLYIITFVIVVLIMGIIVVIENHSRADLSSKEMEVVEQQVLRQSVTSWRWGTLFSGWVNCLDFQYDSVGNKEDILPLFECYPYPLLAHVRYCVMLGKNLTVEEVFPVNQNDISDEKEIKDFLQKDDNVENAIFDSSRKHSLRFILLPSGKTYLVLFGCRNYDRLRSMPKEERKKVFAEAPLGFLFLIDVKNSSWNTIAKTDSGSVVDVLYYNAENQAIFDEVLKRGKLVTSSVMSYYLYIQSTDNGKYAYVVFRDIEDNPAICYKIKFSEEVLAAENQRRVYRLIMVGVLLAVLFAMIYLAWSHNRQREFYERRLEYMSFHDKLTDAYNRSYSDIVLKDIEKANEFPTAIIIIDVNGLKMVNDTLGHTEGDALLKNVVAILKKEIYAGSYIFRIGGDEFMLLLLGRTLVDAEILVEKIKSSMKSFNDDNTKNFPVSMSFGCVVWKNASERVEDLFNLADERMYREKQTQKDKVRMMMIENLLARIDTHGIIPDDHEERLVAWINKLSERMLFTETEKKNMMFLARYHNIGKVGIEQGLLRKKEMLDENEKAKLKGYVVRGCEIARQCGTLNDISKMILCQNENWDGSGYPLGVTREDIARESRVLSVLNSFDIMINGLCYREKKTIEDAKAELASLAGERYDPAIVEAFLEIV